MKIDRIEWWEVDQFVHQEMVNSPEYAQTHEQWDLVPKYIIRLNTDDGHYGVGETSRGAARGDLETACRSGQGAQGILESLFERLDRFVAPDRQLEDDASLVVLKVPEAVTLPSVQGRSIA